MVLADYLVLAFYFALMASIGFICMRRVKVQEDYFMGGRGFGKLLQTFAAFGAGTGSSDPVNVGRTTFTNGMSGMWSVMYWLFVTPFYWITAVWYRRMRHLTLGDWFAERYESRRLAAAYALFGILFYMIYGSMLFSAIGKVAAPLVGSGSLQFGSMTIGLEYVLVPLIGAVVLIYGITGGLEAAYWTDLVQGLCIVLLSILLIPYGLWALVEKFGDPATQGMMDGFRIMHEQVPRDFFSVIGTSETSDFPLVFILAVVLINLVGIVVQPHFIATGGGSAKNENDARIGLVAGNFLKRFCTIGWVLTALIALALFADRPELAQDPDKTWGLASRELLGPGLTGLMLACLLAALMSSVDVYMIVSSALVVRNIYVPFIRPQATELQCLRIARLTGIFVVAGSVGVSLWMMDVFRQLQLTWIVPVLFAAPFWMGIYWRRATTAAAWTTVLFSCFVFFLIPWLAPVVVPSLSTNPEFTQVTPVIETTTVRTAAPSDIARRRAITQVWDEELERLEQETGSHASLSALGPRPEALQLGDQLTEIKVRGGTAIFWSGPVRPVDELGNVLQDTVPQPTGPARQSGNETTRVTKRYAESVRLEGTGNFKLDFLLYALLGLDLSGCSDSTLKTLELPPKIVMPFLVMMLVSLLTRRNSQTALDRYYVKMKTPVDPDHTVDIQNLEESYQNPHKYDHRRWIPYFDLEMQKPNLVDVCGFLVCFVICFAIIGLAIWIAQIGS